MIKLNKFEAAGFAISIGAMALALFIMRLDGSLEGKSALSRIAERSGNQSAGVIVAEGGIPGVETALDGAISGNRVNKLVITDVRIGNGAEVKVGDQVEVHYIGTLQNGQEFDNTHKKGATYTFTVGDKKVIAGWNEGVVGMQKGGQRILIVPAEMAYGKEGYGPIPGNATVVYAIELLNIK